MIRLSCFLRKFWSLIIQFLSHAIHYALIKSTCYGKIVETPQNSTSSIKFQWQFSTILNSKFYFSFYDTFYVDSLLTMSIWDKERSCHTQSFYCDFVCLTAQNRFNGNFWQQKNKRKKTLDHEKSVENEFLLLEWTIQRSHNNNK